MTEMDLIQRVRSDGCVPLAWAGGEAEARSIALGPALGAVIVALITGLPVRRVPLVSAGPRLIANGVAGQNALGGTVWYWGSWATLKALRPGGAGQRFVADETTVRKLTALRGPHSAAILSGGQLPPGAPPALGDPAALLPSFYAPPRGTDAALGVVLPANAFDPGDRPEQPRETAPWLERSHGGEGVRLLASAASPAAEAIGAQIDRILSCRRIVSTLPEVLALAEAYGIPNLPLIVGGPAGLIEAGTTTDGPLPLPLADLYAGFGRQTVPVWRQPAGEATRWQALCAAIDHAWQPTEVAAERLAQSLPIDPDPIAPRPGRRIWDLPQIRSIDFAQDMAALRAADRARFGDPLARARREAGATIGSEVGWAGLPALAPMPRTPRPPRPAGLRLTRLPDPHPSDETPGPAGSKAAAATRSGATPFSTRGAAGGAVHGAATLPLAAAGLLGFALRQPGIAREMGWPLRGVAAPSGPAKGADERETASAASGALAHQDAAVIETNVSQETRAGASASSTERTRPAPRGPLQCRAASAPPLPAKPPPKRDRDASAGEKPAGAASSGPGLSGDAASCEPGALAVPLSWAAGARDDGFANIGDALSAVVVATISGLPVRHMAARSPHERLAAVGTIGHSLLGGRVHLWGTGLDASINPEGLEGGWRPPARTEFIVHAVRGPETAATLRRGGVPAPEVFGDPVYFLPRIWPLTECEKTHELGVVLHLSELDEKTPEGQPAEVYLRYQIPEALRDSVRIITMYAESRLDAFEAKIAEIVSCRRILSTSLHGLVLADAYGIPSAWFGLYGRGLKHVDLLDPGARIDHRMRDLYGGLGLTEVPVFATPRHEPTDWDAAIKAFDSAILPSGFDASGLLAAWPGPLAVEPEAAVWPLPRRELQGVIL
ncbi:MAG: polysaccharide pyruvyl transferase family protein [Pseudomonadota bacterium]